jgi:aryl-alcohol dehydrogenase-like predicted oxidoreductase
MAESTNVTAEDSLRRLQTDYIDRIADPVWT